MTPPDPSSGQSRAPLWRPLGAVLLAAGVLAAYFATHKPVPPENLPALIGTGLDLLAAGLVLAAGLGVGRTLLDLIARRARLDFGRTGRAAQVSISGLLGLAVFSAAALALGLAGLFQSAALWTLVVAVLIIGWRGLGATLRDLRALRRAAHPNSRFGVFLMAFVLIQLGTALAVALAPPHGWDALTYHLVEPQRALAAGRMTGYADNFYLGLPKLVETLYGLAMGLFGRDTAAAPVHFGFGLLGLLAVMGLARRWTGRAESGWLAAALLLGGYNTWLLLGYAYVDLAIFALASGAIVLALVWENDRRTGWLLVAGLLAGSAAGVKYTAAPLTIALGLLVLVRARRAALRPLLVLTGAAALAYLPWALRGLLLYGNPIYPYLFGGLGWDAARTAAANQAGRGLLALGRAWHLPLLPFAATVVGGDFEGTYFYTAGPWLLTLPFLLFFGWPWVKPGQRRAVGNALLLLAPLFLAWGAAASSTGVGIQTRLAIAIFPLMTALGSLAIHVIEAMPKKPLQAGFILKALLAVTFSLSLLETAHTVISQRSLAPLTGVTAQEDYFRDGLGPLGEALAQLDNLPDGARVRFLYEPRGYVCGTRIICLGDTLFDFWSGARRTGASPEAIFAGWADDGDSYLLFFNEGHRLWTEDGMTYWPAEDAELPAALDSLGAPVWVGAGGLYSLYQLPAP
ncbi:MAG: glycosyltransferase family 39 protein [Anaerolineae bacterium]|nr:glycosyltransferase family 39 protein [Anaerolineae bacterium]